MAYREAPPAKPPRTFVYGPFRLAWVRLAWFAVFALASVGALRSLADAQLDCDRQECRLHLGWVTRRFALSDLKGGSITGWGRVLLPGMKLSNPEGFIPQIELTTGPLVLFDVGDKAQAQGLFDRLQQFLDSDEPSLSVHLSPVTNTPILQLCFFLPPAILLLFWAMRGGGGTIRLTVDDKWLAIQRRWGPIGGRMRRFAVADFRGVEVERRGHRQGFLLLLTRGTRNQSVNGWLSTVRPEAHDEAAQELRIALQCPVVPDEPPAPPRRGPVGASAVAFALLGLPYGVALFLAVDLLINCVGGSGGPSATSMLACISASVLFGVALGIYRVR